MKSVVLVSLFLVFGYISCHHQLQGNYQSQYSVKSERSFEETWNRTIDLFAKNGLSIETIEKVSGIIVSTKHSFQVQGRFTQEQDGQPQEPKAWFVVPRIKGLWPTSIIGKFNVRIQEISGVTTISVNLFDLAATTNKAGDDKWGSIAVESTGIFEKSIADQLK